MCSLYLTPIFYFNLNFKDLMELVQKHFWNSYNMLELLYLKNKCLLGGFD